MQIILGSSSPRRREIMSYFALPFEQVSPDFDERTVPWTGDPEGYITQLAEGKAKSIFELHPHKPILTADTIVYKEGKIYHKPANDEAGFKALSELVGTWHTVYTGVCILHNEEMAVEVVKTRIELENLTPEQIRRYQLGVHCADKAGGYMAQGRGSLIVKNIDGSYLNAVGLPIQAVRRLLAHVGINLWDYFGSSS